MLKKLSTLLFLSVLTIILIAPLALHAGDQLGPIKIVNPLNCDNLESCITDILRVALAIAIPIATIYFLWAAIKLIKAGAEGDSSKIAEAKKALLWSVIGLFILGALTGIMAILKSLLGVT